MQKNEYPSVSSWQTFKIASMHAAVSVDCVVFGYNEDGLKVLVLDCDMEPFVGKKSLIGELVEQGEGVDEAVKRVLKMWTGIEGLYMEQVQTFGKPNRHPLGRVISVAYYSLVPLDDFHVENELPNLSWKSLDQLKEMAFDHLEILDACLGALRKDIREKPLGFSLLPPKFSIKQLQILYERILDINFDRRNFRRKLNNLGILKDLNEIEQDVSHRPAKLYSFDEESFKKRMEDNLFQFSL